VIFVCQQNAWTTFRVGFFAGIFIVLVAVALVCGKNLTFYVNMYLLWFAFLFVVMKQCTF